MKIKKIRLRNKWNESKPNGFNLFDLNSMGNKRGNKIIWIYILFFVVVVYK